MNEISNAASAVHLTITTNNNVGKRAIKELNEEERRAAMWFKWHTQAGKGKAGGRKQAAPAIAKPKNDLRYVKAHP
uniref:Uncharacterized protein n=1 Tax=Ascaris lumbricoides TaxID=6252 RepID=A0A0M3I2M4_ASCLU